MAGYDLQIVTPMGMRFEGVAESLTVTTTEGQISILTGHTNYMAAVVIGKAKLTANGKNLYAACGNGFLSVENGKCTLLTNSFDFADTLDGEKLKEELTEAEKLLENAQTANDKTIAKDRIKLASVRLAVLET